MFDLDVQPQSTRLFDVVGLLPATDRTPDIFYCDGPSSEKVAALTFLTIWFMDAEIQKLVMQRAASVICGLSPLSGGRRLETSFAKEASVTDISKRVETFDLSSMGGKYTASCFYPDWSGDKMLRQGFFSVYAASVNEDENNGYTALWQEKLGRQFEGMQLPEESSKYHAIFHKATSDNSFGVGSIFNAFALPEKDRDACLGRILRDEFSDINSLYDMVPKRAAHEVAHLLERGSGLVPHTFIQDEINAKLPRKSRMLSHYRKASEAVAELAGIAILRQVQDNANLGFGIPTTMLDKILPDSFDFVEAQIAKICAKPSV